MPPSDTVAVPCSRCGQVREPSLLQPLPDGDAPLCRECWEQLSGATCLALDQHQLRIAGGVSGQVITCGTKVPDFNPGG